MAALGVMDPFVNQLDYISKFAFNFYRQRRAIADTSSEFEKST